MSGFWVAVSHHLGEETAGDNVICPPVGLNPEGKRECVYGQTGLGPEHEAEKSSEVFGQVRAAGRERG